MFETYEKIFSGIHYQLINAHPEKPCLVFLHGLGGDLTPFNPIREYFHTFGFPTLAIDLRGQGKSIRPKDITGYLLEKLAGDVHEILESEKFSRYVIIGHSGGGIIAQIVCSKYPDKIIGLALVNSTAKINSRLAQFVKNSKVFRFISGCISFLPSWHYSDYADYRKFVGTRDYDWKRIGSDIIHTGLRSYLILFLEYLKFDATELDKQIHIPTLVIGGGKDTVFSKEMTIGLSKLINNSTYVDIEETNHISVINHPQAVCEEIGSFLEKLK